MKTKIYALIISFGFSCMYLMGQTLCPAPSGLTLSNLTSNAVTLSWNAVNTPSNYKVSYQASTPANSSVLFVNTNSNTATLTNLTALTTYMAKVQKVCESVGLVVYSDPIMLTFTTLGGSTNPCAVPLNLLATEITATAAKLTWNAVSGASSYNVQYRVSNSTASFITVNSSVNYLIRTNLSAATNYEFKVQTVCGGANGGAMLTSDYSAIKSFSTPSATPNPCAVPVELSAKEITSNSARLTWNAVSGAISYNVTYGAINSVVLTTVNTKTNSLNIGSLNPATNYQFKVQTVCGASGTNTIVTSAYSLPKSFVTLAGGNNNSCVVPLNIMANYITSNSGKITWNTVLGAISYNILYKASNSSVYLLLNTPTNFANLISLSPATVYEYQVQTVCSKVAGTNTLITSAYSPIKSFVTIGGAPNPCPGPTNLIANVQSFNSAVLSWNSNVNSGFNIKYKPLNSLNWTGSFWSTKTKTIMGLMPNTSYEWKVQAVCSSSTNNGLFSDWVSGPLFKTRQQLLLGPNPIGTNLKLYYQAGSSQQISCTIHDYYGKVVLSQNKEVMEGSNEIDIAIDAVENGIYFVQVKGSDGSQLMKFLVQH